MLEIKNLKTVIQVRDVQVHAVQNFHIRVEEGEIVGIVGESGSGKSIAMKSVMGILPSGGRIDGGEINFDGKRLDKMSDHEMRGLRGKEVAMIFQDPMTALNPMKNIGSHLIENIRRHNNVDKKTAHAKALEALKDVGIPSPEARMSQYPHEFSGGMRQRIMIAMALSLKPKLLIADEPTTALDVTTQSQILDLIKELQQKNKMSIILITHDLGIVAKLCDKISVMYGGMVMEEGLVDEIFYNPKSPYTQALLKALPNPEDDTKERLYSIKGSAPNVLIAQDGCPFYERCDFAFDMCKQKLPTTVAVSATQCVKCFYAENEVLRHG